MLLTTSTIKLFGTDGIRGLYGTYPITDAGIYRISRAIAQVIRKKEGRPPSFLIGSDTRSSADSCRLACCLGLLEYTDRVVDIGVVPTPALAYLLRKYSFDAAIMITASHNSYQDNGIKVFWANGQKIPRSLEIEIEESFILLPDTPLPLSKKHFPAPLLAARLYDDYRNFVLSSVPEDFQLKNLSCVIDCAHGAFSELAPRILKQAGAEVLVINSSPNGININEKCGATHIAALQAAVCKHGASIGFSFDGDGDRVIAVDQHGNMCNGDMFLYIIACHWHQSGRLRGVVGTVMTNTALQHFFEAQNIPFMRAPLGDRDVIEALIKKGWNLGGEPSGHLILSDWHTTADGLLAVLQVLHILYTEKKSLQDYLSDFSLYPQVILNVPCAVDCIWETESVRDVIIQVERLLGDAGRVLVRMSGTEAVVRILVESQNEKYAMQYAKKIATAIKNSLHLSKSLTPSC